MSIHGGLFRYLADCYRENGSRTGIFSLKGSRVRQALVVEGQDVVVSEAVLEGNFFVPGEKAAKLANQARLHEKDRDLFYGSVFLMGKVENGGGGRLAYAPLILYSASVSQVIDEDGAEFEIDTSQRQLNYALLESLGDEAFLRRIESSIEVAAHTEGCVGELRRLFEEYLPDCNANRLLSYPNLLSDNELKKVFTSNEIDEGMLVLAPGAALFLADKSTEMRGVLNDLQSMGSQAEELSCPVAAVVGRDVIRITENSAPREEGHVPACLSEAQTKILDSAARKPLTLAVGPPGTGKSFTIAALAIEAMSRGESVLIASRMDHAVDVVADKIEESLNLDGVCVRAGRKNYLRELKGFLENLLSGAFSSLGTTAKEIKKANRELRKFAKEIQKTEYALERRAQREEKWGEILSAESPGWFTRWRQGRIRKHAASDILAAQVAATLSGMVDIRIEREVDQLKRIRDYHLCQAMLRHRKTFQAFSKGIRARTSHKKEEYFEGVSWNALLTALPVWLVNLSDLHRVIPMQKELFDLVIIDEASQCDIASALPALQRARRAVITGDPKQLRHISFLPVARQKEFGERHGLDEEALSRFDFRNVSLVDLVGEALEDQDAVVFLNEHFRSRPEIIGFSNHEFYADRLAIMTGHREVDRFGDAANSLYRVEGTRSDQGVNAAEIDAIFEQLESLTQAEEPALSIGILSPFRAQVDAIMKRLESSLRLNEWISRHDLLVGTAHSFQGEERDVMFLSLALDNESPSASFRFMEKDDVFNVSITRARIENRIFSSFGSEGRSRGLVGRYLGYVQTGSKPAARVSRVESVTQPGLVEMMEALEEQGWEVEVGFELGGYTLDALCHAKGRTIGIDLIGFPGPYAPAMSLDRYLMLRRAGIELFPVSLLEWQDRREEVLAEMTRWLG